MDDITRKVKELKFWRLELSSKIERQNYPSAAKNLLYKLYMITGNTIIGYEYALGSSREVFRMMKEELDAVRQSEAFEVYSKFNHSLQEPVVDEKAEERISTLYKVLDHLISNP